jgi:DNA-binding LacI/PurR family transcriptional regulator
VALPKSHAVRPPTIYDVARVAGVSHQTVSRFLRGNTGLKMATRERVQAAIAELGYRPNSTARALATSRSYRIGALVYELQELGPSLIAKGATDAARTSGYLLDIVALDPEDDEAIAHAIGLLDDQNLAGILALAPTHRLRDALQAADYQVPLVIDAEGEYENTTETETLNTIGTRLAVEHLIELGHRRILHISGPHEWISASNRLAAYRHTLGQAGLATFESIEGDWSAASGYAAGRAMPAESGFTAVVVANDQMALGALRAFTEMGLRVPEDISVVGFDDIPESEFLIPPLTTVRLDFAEQGRFAVETLVARIEGREAPIRPSAMTATLVPRNSTAPPRG